MAVGFTIFFPNKRREQDYPQEEIYWRSTRYIPRSMRSMESAMFRVVLPSEPENSAHMARKEGGMQGMPRKEWNAPKFPLRWRSERQFSVKFRTTNASLERVPVQGQLTKTYGVFIYIEHQLGLKM